MRSRTRSWLSALCSRARHLAILARPCRLDATEAGAMDDPQDWDEVATLLKGLGLA